MTKSSHPSGIDALNTQIQNFADSTALYDLPSPQRSLRNFFRGNPSPKYEREGKSDSSPSVTWVAPVDQVSDTLHTESVTSATAGPPQHQLASPMTPEHTKSSSRKGHPSGNGSHSRESMSLYLSSSRSPSESYSSVTSARKKPCTLSSNSCKSRRRFTLSLGLSPLSPVPRIPAPTPNIEEISCLLYTRNSPKQPSSSQLQSPFATTKFNMLPGLAVWRRSSPRTKCPSYSQSPPDPKHFFESFGNNYFSPPSNEFGLTSASSIEDFAEPRSLPSTPHRSNLTIDRTRKGSMEIGPKELPRIPHALYSERDNNITSCATSRNGSCDPLIGPVQTKPHEFYTEVHDDPNLPFLLYTINDKPIDEVDYCWYDINVPLSDDVLPGVMSSLPARKHHSKSVLATLSAPSDAVPGAHVCRSSSSHSCGSACSMYLDAGMGELVKMIPCMLRDEFEDNNKVKARPRNILHDLFNFQSGFQQNV